jgi:cytochrome b561
MAIIAAMLRNTSEAWGTPAKFFHWLMAALILAQISLGWSAALWRLSPLKLDLFVWHKSTGVLLLALLVLRLLWRLGNRPPAAPADQARVERLAASTVHALLYALMLALPLTGWVINSAANVPFRVFWLFPLPAIVEPDKALADLAAQWHLGLVMLLTVLLILHVAAALYHHYVRRDGVLLRMLPGRGA